MIREESPTNTKGLQDAFRGEIEQRIRRVRGVIRESIVDNDALGIKGGSGSRVNQPEEEPDTPELDSREEFPFEQNPTKQIAFRNQLQEWIDDGILEPASTREQEEGEHYTAVYINAAAAEGLNFADNWLDERGVSVPDEVIEDEVLRRPFHVETLETLYSRSYSNLESITEDLDRTISQVLVRSMLNGWGTRRTADLMTKEARDIQHSRARAFARTEMLHAHNQTALNRYREYNISEVEIVNHTPCEEICLPIVQGGPYPIDEIPLGGPPFHPNCVGSVIPVVS